MPNTSRILLVEDDPDALSGLFMLLTRAGHSVLTAENGSQAVDLLTRGIQPALLLLDLMLPKASGWEVLKLMQHDPVLREIPVIVMTGLGEREAHVVGADRVLQKPLQIEQLLAEIDALINRGREKPS
jgi:DNA-binding response OmpR family regulator